MAKKPDPKRPPDPTVEQLTMLLSADQLALLAGVLQQFMLSPEFNQAELPVNCFRLLDRLKAVLLGSAILPTGASEPRPPPPSTQRELAGIDLAVNIFDSSRLLYGMLRLAGDEHDSLTFNSPTKESPP